MPGIVLGDSSSTTNPLLPFFHQANGFLADVTTKVSTGYYIAVLDPSGLSPALTAGPYEIVWSYVVSSGGPTETISYTFEVLSNLYFRSSRQFVNYADSAQAKLSKYKVEERQSALLWASQEIERITGRFFFPRYLEMRHSVRPKSSTLWLDQPVIGLSGIDILTENLVTGQTSTYSMDNNYLRVFNRHLDRLLSPDDRQNPKIQFASTGSATQGIAPPRFSESNLGLKVKGAFGCTDPDGGPMGCVPSGIEEVALALAGRRLSSTGTSADPFLNQPGRIKMAKTRDQAVAYDTSRSRDAILTGDPRLDAILEGFMRPPHVGVAG